MAQHDSKKVKEQRRKKTNKAAYIGTLIGLALVGILGVVIWVVNVNANVTVLQVGDMQAKKNLYSCVYYCDTLTKENWTQYGFDNKKSPYAQPFTADSTNEESFANWGEYFEYITNNTLKYLLVMTQTAEKGGYTYTDEVQNQVDAELKALAEQKGTAKHFRTYMIETYGADIQKKDYKEYLLLFYRAREFYQKITQDKALFEKYIGVGADAFEESYRSHKDDIDVVSFRYYYLKDTKENAESILKMKQVTSEKAFKELCNSLQNDENFTENDSSLFKNYSLKSLLGSNKGELAKHVSAATQASKRVYFAKTTIEDEAAVEFLWLVEPRSKDTTAYNNTNVAKWEYAAMGILLENYYDNNYSLSVSDTGIESFRDSMLLSAQ